MHTKNILLLKKIEIESRKEARDEERKCLLFPKETFKMAIIIKKIFSPPRRVNNGLFENKSFAS
jgi:hypothetical protein